MPTRCGSDRRQAVTKNDPRVTRVGALHPQDLDRRTAAALQRRVQGQPVARRAAPARRQRQADDRLYDDVVDGYFARHRVKPGITGWAQINGWRGETDTHEKIQRRVEHDLYYIENWSVLFDLYILLLTPFRLLRRRTPIERHGARQAARARACLCRQADCSGAAYGCLMASG